MKHYESGRSVRRDLSLAGPLELLGRYDRLPMALRGSSPVAGDRSRFSWEPLAICGSVLARSEWLGEDLEPRNCRITWQGANGFPIAVRPTQQTFEKSTWKLEAVTNLQHP